MIPTFISCSDSDTINIDLCNECVLINKDVYDTTTTNNYTINSVKLIGDLITVQIISGGCNGNSWVATLIDANQILESNPSQRNIIIRFENNEACFAIVEKKFTFNIKELKENQTEILLNLEGWNTQINYK